MARKKSLSDINKQFDNISRTQKSIMRSAQARMRNALKRSDVAEYAKQSQRYQTAKEQGTKAFNIFERYRKNIAGKNDYWFSPEVNHQRKYAQSRYAQGRVSG